MIPTGKKRDIKLALAVARRKVTRLEQQLAEAKARVKLLEKLI